MGEDLGEGEKQRIKKTPSYSPPIEGGQVLYKLIYSE